MRHLRTLAATVAAAIALAASPANADKDLFQGSRPITHFELACDTGAHGVSQHWALQDGKYLFFTRQGGQLQRTIKSHPVERSAVSKLSNDWSDWTQITLAAPRTKESKDGADLLTLTIKAFDQADADRWAVVSIETNEAYLDGNGYLTFVARDLQERESCMLTFEHKKNTPPNGQ